MNDIPQAPEHDVFGILPSDDNGTSTEPPQGSPDTIALIEEIGRLAKLVGFLKAENERLAAERHDFRLQLEQLQNMKAREEAAVRAKR